MWLYLIIAVAVLALAAFAFWPRKRGIVDADVRSARRTTHGSIEERYNTNAPQFPPGGGV